MKPRSRELSIFSMSALDLFASGMGAFILLAIMALPFFPNTGSAPEPVPEPEPAVDAGALEDALEVAERERDEERQRAEQLAEELRQTIEELLNTSQARDQAQQQAASLRNQVAELEVPDLDLVICLDVSGSMSEQVSGLKQQISDLGRILNAVAPTGIGVVAFGDRFWERPLFVQNVTTNMPVLENFINGLAPQMGLGSGRNDDSPEALAMALERAVTMNWRAESESRYVVIMSDFPAYPERVDAALRAAQIFAAQDGHHVSAVMVNGSATGRAAEPFMRLLANAGNGEFVDGEEKTLVGSILLAVLLP